MTAKNDKCRTAIAARLSRAEGQMRAVRKMVDDGRECVEVLRQLSAIDGAVRAAARVIVSSHLEMCLDKPTVSEHERLRMTRELSDIFGRFG